MCCGINVDIYNVKFELKYLHEKKNTKLQNFNLILENVNFTTFFHFIILCDDDNKA